jgi:outer membrane biosynthesis protein TonB
MSNGFYYSLLLHTCILLMMFVGIPMVHHDVNTDYAIVAEVVPVSELTNIKVRSATKIAKEEKSTNKAAKAVEEKSQQDKKSEAKSVEDAESIPDKDSKDKKKTDKKDVKKEEKKDDKKKKDDNFEKSILKSLEADSSKKTDKKLDKEFTELEKALKGDTNKEYNSNAPMSMSEIDSIKAQITSKWNTAAFSGSSEMGMQAVVKIELDMDGNVLSAKPIGLGSNQSQYYRSFVESAVRAVRAASPLQHLTKEKFHSWKEIEFRFDSSGMIY